jgi:UDP-glucose 4-epimerase
MVQPLPEIQTLREQGLTFPAIAKKVGLTIDQVKRIYNEHYRPRDIRHILVTGGFGFIGGHLIQRLLQDRDNRVHVVDNLSSNPIPVDILLADLNYPDALTYDTCSVKDFCQQNERSDWSMIYHLASPVGPVGVLKYAGSMAKIITEDTYGLMRIALQSECRIVDVSTSEIYGGGQQGLCAEDMPRIVQSKETVRLEYAVGKLAAEIMLMNSVAAHGLDAVIIRPFNVSGPRQSGKGGFVLPRFIAQAMTGNPLTVFGDGSQIRAFTHVYDIVDGILLAAEKGETGTAYNMGNPNNRTTILDLAQQVISFIGRGEIIYVNPHDLYGPLYAEAADKYPDASRAIDTLGWEPTRSIVDTIKSTYLYMTWTNPSIFERLAGFPVEYNVWETLSIDGI